MARLSAAYLASTAVYFEPADREEAEAIQKRLIDLGYAWGINNQATISYLNRCVDLGITALPSGRMFCGEPADHKVVRHPYEDLTGEPLLRAAMRETLNEARDGGRVINELRRHIDAETGKLKRSMHAEFDQIARRQQTIEDTQAQIMARLDEVLALLKPKPLDLEVKKPAIGKKP